jgi:hypothetical protein
MTEKQIAKKTNQVKDFAGMTVNERLYLTGLMDEFYSVRNSNKEKAALILRYLKVDEASIKDILKI